MNCRCSVNIFFPKRIKSFFLAGEAIWRQPDDIAEAGTQRLHWWRMATPLQFKKSWQTLMRALQCWTSLCSQRSFGGSRTTILDLVASPISNRAPSNSIEGYRRDFPTTAVGVNLIERLEWYLHVPCNPLLHISRKDLHILSGLFRSVLFAFVHLGFGCTFWIVAGCEVSRVGDWDC